VKNEGGVGEGYHLWLGRDGRSEATTEGIGIMCQGWRGQGAASILVLAHLSVRFVTPSLGGRSNSSHFEVVGGLCALR
jgi:hypothetical protein